MAKLDRRELLTRTTRLAAGTCLGCGVGRLWTGQAAAAADMPRGSEREVDFYEPLPDKRIQCFVCPLHCTLEDGETCFCRTRTNYGGRLRTDAYANPCILTTDAIEKLPLNHFLPGTKALTLACGGCNLRCLYCQNWQQSQVCPNDIKTYSMSPQQAVDAAVEAGVPTIALGYTEPIAFLEYARDIAVLAKKRGLRVAVATAAFVDPAPLVDFAKYVDAFVVTLKGFDDEAHHGMTGVHLGPIKTAIETIKTKTKCWLEIAYLVVPTYNDDTTMIKKGCAWIRKTLGRRVPVHFARFEPSYELKNLPRTPVQTLEHAVATARKLGLQCVYTSNIAPHRDTATRCIKCDTTLIQRLGFKLIENHTQNGKCPNCHTRQPGVWA